MPTTLKGNRIPYTQMMQSVSVTCTAAKTTETDTTNAQLLYTAPADGAPAVLTSLVVNTQATVTATRCKLYRQKGGTGALRQIRNRLLPAVTVNETTGQTEVDFGYSKTNPLGIGPNDKIYCAIGVAATGVDFDGVVEEYQVAT